MIRMYGCKHKDNISRSDCFYKKSSTVTRLVKSVTIPAGDSVEVVQGKVVLKQEMK